MRKPERCVLYPSMTRLNLQTPISRFPKPTSKKPQTLKWNNKELMSCFIWVADLGAAGYEREWGEKERVWGVAGERECVCGAVGGERVCVCVCARERETRLRVNEKDTLQGFEMNWVCVFQRNTIKGRGNEPTHLPCSNKEHKRKKNLMLKRINGDIFCRWRFFQLSLKSFAWCRFPVPFVP